MKLDIKKKLEKRIKDGKCFICNEEPKEKTNINHQVFGNVTVCIKHFNEKVE
jgi:hypothetical protein